MQADQLTAFAALITAIFAAAVSLMSSRSKSRADEIVLLRDEVKRLHDQQAKLEKKVEELEIENSFLYRVLLKHGIDAEVEMEQLRIERTVSSARSENAKYQTQKKS